MTTLFFVEYTVYILFSKSLNRLYIGHTSESVDQRLRKHLSAHKGFTAKAKDWELKHTENYLSKSEAYKRELAIKKKKSRKYIEFLINAAD